MFYIRQKPNYWEIEERLYNGSVNYINLPTPEYFSRNAQTVVLQVGAITFKMRRQDVVVPQGESLDSFLSALLNPSPSIKQGGGGGAYVEQNSSLVNLATYFVSPDENVIICPMNCTVVLPDTVLGEFEFEIYIKPGYIVSLKGTSPDTVDYKDSVKLYGGEMVTVKNFSITPNNWFIGK